VPPTVSSRSTVISEPTDTATDSRVDPSRRGLQRIGLMARLMLVSGLVLLLGGGTVLGALVLRDSAALQIALQFRGQEELDALVPLIAAEQAASGLPLIEQAFTQRVRAKSIHAIEWTDRDGSTVQATDAPTESVAPAWFRRLLVMRSPVVQQQLSIGGAGRGRLTVRMTATPARNHLWGSF